MTITSYQQLSIAIEGIEKHSVENDELIEISDHYSKISIAMQVSIRKNSNNCR